jgi:hypothetical protein
MLHKNRIFAVSPVETAPELAEKLTRHTWTCCTGFSLTGHPEYLFLNDSFSEDGAQEYAVLKRSREGRVTRQVESITFGWCSQDRALELIQEVVSGAYDDGSWPISVRTEPSSNHHCGLCA